ncbi:class I SAM-dependent methyltransferase [Agrococcus carbonis]|uniref:Methyltransferase small domain-containing protein n=1 Tax=Agrococcus carbonis TaxID=684552 RepID=A0A1H1KYP7_9MICO|nr:methyltransferase [Agrococcus carbonis]SDR67478.1 Methyltransferase small domain-containing protein [Agrococcus carbonis]
MDSARVDALAHDLAAAGFTDEGVGALLGDDAHAALGRMLAAPARRAALAAPGPLATLVRALWLGDAVEPDELADALPSLGVEGAVALGLVARRDGRLEPRMTIRPHRWRDAGGEGEWWIASDPDELAGVRPLPDDHVLGVGGAARTLAALLPPVTDAPAGDALDLGTGCGVLALHLRRRAARVVATDVSERALAYTRLNAALNGVDGIETRLGSLYEPVADERFDLVASNPPFVITPRAEGVPAYAYRDGGRTGDALMHEVVAGAAAHLRPGGHARLLGNWESTRDEPGIGRALGWASGELDAWVLERESLDPVAYAELWLRDGGTLPRDPAHDGMLGAWLDDFGARGVVSVGMGWLALRRPHGTPSLARAERIPQPVQLEHAGAHLAAALEDAERLAALDDAALAEQCLVTARDVTEARHQLPGADGPNVIELRQGGALARTLSVDTALAALVGASDGELPVRRLVSAIAQLLEVDERALADDLLPRVRELVRTAFLLLPADAIDAHTAGSAAAEEAADR